MSELLGNLKPQAVFHYFEQMTKIPRESGNEAAISDYLVNFAKEHNLDYVQEACKNVIITKPATPGYEDAPRVILQGHMDMVCVKDDELDFNFETDALPIYVDGDWLRTKGTTLGADNGIAVAMSLAILADDTLDHPALTVLVTTEEETGASMELIADYPEWEFETESKVRDIMKDVYQQMFGKALEVSAIHAGLECGFLSQKLGKIDMISIGPDITGAHTPKESLSIPSTERVYNFLCEVLKAIK